MIPVWVVWLYVVGWFVSTPILAAVLAVRVGHRKVESIDLVFGFAMSLFWPVVWGSHLVVSVAQVAFDRLSKFVGGDQ